MQSRCTAHLFLHQRPSCYNFAAQSQRTPAFERQQQDRDTGHRARQAHLGTGQQNRERNRPATRNVRAIPQ